MPASTGRESPIEQQSKHQHSLSELGRSNIPMWDSSDPERAPPPLPLNPGSSTPKPSPTKPNTSVHVAATAQALFERAQNSLASPYTINPPIERPHERSPTRAAQHKRLQSLQNGSSREFKSHAGTASEKVESRPTTPNSSRELILTSPEQLMLRSGSPTPTQSSKDEEEGVKPRPLPRPPMRENTPPSATMLALKNMQVPDIDVPLGDITNGAAPRSTPDFEKIHSQMKDLTAIANALQTEMTALSKRSRDNASDLMALKKATSSRDEDIKKSLHELVSNRNKAEQEPSPAPPRSEMSESASALSVPQYILDHKTIYSPPLHKAASMSRVPTMLDTESHVDFTRAPSPSPYSIDSTSSTVMLEKIIREMATKDGQEQLLTSLSDLIIKYPHPSNTDSRLAFAAQPPVSDNEGFNSETLDRLQEVLNGLRSDVSRLTEKPMDMAMSYEILDTLKDGFSGIRLDVEHLESLSDLVNKSSQQSAMGSQLTFPPQPAGADNEAFDNEALEKVQEALNDLRSDVSRLSEKPPIVDMTVSYEILDALKDGLSSVRLDMEHLKSESSEKGGALDSEAIESLQEALNDLRNEVSQLSENPPTVDMTISYQILDALKDGVSSIRSDVEHLKPGPSDEGVGFDSEAVDKLQQALNDLRGDVFQLSQKPPAVDMTVSHEILDALKDGLSSIRSDVEQLKSAPSDNQVVLAEPEQNRQGDDATKPVDIETPSRADFERLEVMLAQLQIKIEALDQNIGSQPHQEISPSVTVKEDLAGIEFMLGGLKTSLDGLASKEAQQPQVPLNGVVKEDVDAVETLVHNINAKLDDTVVPGIENIITREHLDSVEALIRMTHESIESISSQLGEEHSPNQEIEGLAQMMHDTSTVVCQIKEKLDAPEQEEKLKEDMNIIRDVCDDIKVKLDDVPSGMPSKADIEELSEMLAGLRDSHQALKEKYEGDISVTAKAFDDRKNESSKILESIDDLRGSIEETRDHLKSRIKRGNEDVRVFDEILQGIEEKIDAIPTSAPDTDELRETVQAEVAKMAEAIGDIRNDHESRCATIIEKSEEQRAAIIDEMLSKLDLCFNDIKLRQEEQQQVLGEATLTMTEKQKEQDDLVTSSKAMAEELKVTIDTLGSSVQAIDPALREVTEKFSDDAKTVFARVEEMSSKIEDGSVDSKTNHQLTRDEVANTVAAIGSVQATVAANHPQVMEALATLRSAIESNFDHFKANNATSEKLTDGLKAHFDEGLRRLPVPQIEAPKAETITTVDEKLHAKLDEILDKGVSAKYDDSPMLTKLDELLGHASKSSAATAHFSRFDDLQQQLTSTASEVSAFVAFQTKLITAEHDNKEKEADQAALDLSNSLNEKERIDGEIASLRDTKSSLATEAGALRDEVATLKREREELQKQKLHLSADASSLETALRLRREELTLMDSRADALERRIIEGVMDHSRALLLAKQPRSRAGPDSMNLKRVSSNTSHSTSATLSTRRTATPSVVNAATNMALRACNGKMATTPGTANSPRGDRRIASLSQINNNVPAGGRQLAATSNRNISTGLGTGLKRSQSVRTQKTRKLSWQPGSGSLQGISDDKENESISEDDGRTATPTPDGQDDTMSLSRATSMSRPPPTGADGVISRQTSVSHAPPTDSETSLSRATSFTRPRTNTATSRRTSATHSAAPSSRRGSYSTVVTGTSGHDSVVTPSEYSYATTDASSSYFRGTGDGESTVDVSDTASAVTASTDRRRSVGSTIYSNLGSGAGGGDTEVPSDEERIDSEVGTTVEPPEIGYEEDMPAPLMLKGGPQRAPGPDGYDSGLGSDLPTAALSGISGSGFFPGDNNMGNERRGYLGMVEE